MHAIEKVSSHPASGEVAICHVDDLVPNSGVCVLWGETQVALFYLPGSQPEYYALANWDPLGEANVLSRGIVGDLGGEPVVASPLYKQHFSLLTGRCLEVEDVAITTFPVRVSGQQVFLNEPACN